jgi:hypothetical protein
LSGSREAQKMNLEYALNGLFGLGVMVYLVYVLIHPEKL